jgi:hypothetical protein
VRAGESRIDIIWFNSCCDNLLPVVIARQFGGRPLGTPADCQLPTADCRDTAYQLLRKDKRKYESADPSRKEKEMFDQVFESLRKATEETVKLQQELFKKWVGLWPSFPVMPSSWTGQMQDFQKKWAEAVNELLRRQRETTEAQFAAGLQNIEKAFQICEAKTEEELRTKTIELWQNCFLSLRQAFETQTRDFQAAMTKWMEFTKKSAA